MTKRVFVLINVASRKTKGFFVAMDRNSLLAVIGKIEGVIFAQAVTGPYEIIAVIEAERFTEIVDTIILKIASISCIDRCTVCFGTGQVVAHREGDLSPLKVTG
ncbi:MAG: hypothetical protein PHI12_06195 [Dehalococcoidales bacterium]|nr:hypothetical protein [Dehalococcoidales bacterium]